MFDGSIPNLEMLFLLDMKEEEEEEERASYVPICFELYHQKHSFQVLGLILGLGGGEGGFFTGGNGQG